MASRMREDPLIKIHSESSKEHHIEASTCLTMIFERAIKAVPPPYVIQFITVGSRFSLHNGIFIREPRLSNRQDVKIIVIYVVHKTRWFIPY